LIAIRSSLAQPGAADHRLKPCRKSIGNRPSG